MKVRAGDGVIGKIMFGREPKKDKRTPANIYQDCIYLHTCTYMYVHRHPSIPNYQANKITTFHTGTVNVYTYHMSVHGLVH